MAELPEDREFVRMRNAPDFLLPLVVVLVLDVPVAVVTIELDPLELVDSLE